MTTALLRMSKTLHGRAFQRAAFAFLFAALLCAGSATAQTNDSAEQVIETARTPAGELSLVRRRTDEGVTIVFKLGGRVVAEKSASEDGDAYSTASINGLYPKASPRFALVALSTGALVCGAKFTIVDWSRQEAARVSEDFGNCSDAPRAVYHGDTLTLTFPAGHGKHDPGTHYVGPGQVWTYTSGRLRRVGGRR